MAVWHEYVTRHPRGHVPPSDLSKEAARPALDERAHPALMPPLWKEMWGWSYELARTAKVAATMHPSDREARNPVLRQQLTNGVSRNPTLGAAVSRENQAASELRFRLRVALMRRSPTRRTDGVNHDWSWQRRWRRVARRRPRVGAAPSARRRYSRWRNRHYRWYMDRSAAGPRRGLRLVGRTLALCVWFYVGLILLIAVPAALAGVFILPVSIGVVAFAVAWVVMPLHHAPARMSWT